MLAELVREQVLLRTRQEVPHAVEVQIEEIEQGESTVVVRAIMWVETESQKGILIGHHGRMIKAIGTAARKEIERELAEHVHLDLSVRVRRSWRADDALLDRLGITLAQWIRASPALSGTSQAVRASVASRWRMRAVVCLPKATSRSARSARRCSRFWTSVWDSRLRAGARTVVRARRIERIASRPSARRQAAARQRAWP